MPSFAHRKPETRFLKLARTGGVVVLLAATAYLVYGAASGGWDTTPDGLSDDGIRRGKALLGAAALVIAAGTCTLLVSCMLWRQKTSAAVASLAERIRNTIDSERYSGRVDPVGHDELDKIVASVNALLAEVERLGAAIEIHEEMEKKLGSWIKDRQSHESELKQAKAVAETATLAKSQYIATVSHELRTPLHSILSYARFGQLDSRKEKYDEMADYFEIIQESGDNLLLLLNDLLDLSRLESGKMRFELAPRKLSEVVSSVADEFVAILEERNLKITLTTTETDVVMIDPVRAMQVVRNLFDNAVKFSPRGGTIFVDVTGDEDTVTLVVRDQGDGVPKTHLEKIFDKFTQLEKASKAGTGLGLSISRHIVTIQKGRIWAENNDEGGLSLFVQFPSCSEEHVTV